jgi:hypothetical protein
LESFLLSFDFTVKRAKGQRNLSYEARPGISPRQLLEPKF